MLKDPLAGSSTRADVEGDDPRLRAIHAEPALLERAVALSGELVAECDPQRLLERFVHGAAELLGAQRGACFSRESNPTAERYVLAAGCGGTRDALEALAGTSAQGCLALPVQGPDGALLGKLCFAHDEPRVLLERAERLAPQLGVLAGAVFSTVRRLERQAERDAELQAYATRMRLVNEAGREGIWFWDVASNRVEWNDALLDALGVTRAEWGGTFEDWFSRLHPEDAPKLAALLEGHIKRREPYTVEGFRLRHSSGEYRWFTTAGQAEWAGDGRPIRMAGSVRDITDRKLAEENLRASEHRYAQILDSIADMVFCKNERLTVVYANAATCRYYGVSAAELRGLTDVPYNEIDFTQQYNLDDRRVFETGRPVEREAEPNRSPAGELRYFHTVKSPIFDASGKVTELVGVSRDITERKRAVEAQQRLAEATALLGRSIDYETTLGNVARAMVPAAADWCAIDVLEGSALRRVVVAHPDPRKVELAYELERRYPTAPDAPFGVPAVIRSGKSELVTDIPDDLIEKSARDPEHLALVRGLALHSYIVVPMTAHGRVLGAVTLATEGERRFDEADLAFAEELARRASGALENALLYRQLRELNASLERRVDERTSALLESNKELEAFSYTVSHDLRAPVRHIGGFVDLLRQHSRHNLDEKALHYVDTIKAAAQHMGTLIDGLLTFSRLGRAELTKQRVSLEALVATAVREQELETKARPVSWEIGELPEVAADATMLRLVLSNLIANAVKFTRQRESARIEIGARRGEQEVTVWVKDNGTGFDMAYANKLFGVFQRLHSEAEFEGTGIGLATVRRIVHRHGGRVWAESRAGEGAEFYFTLPLQANPE